MITSISYANYLGESISEQQYDELNERSVIYKEGDSIKKIEHYKDGSINNTAYYLSVDETIDSILRQFPDVSIDLIVKSAVGLHTIETTSSYKNGELKFLSKQLLDESLKLLCTQDFDLVTNLPLLNTTEKSLYENENRVLGFAYNEGGAINYIWGDWVENTDQRHHGTIYNDDIVKYFPSLLTAHPYYRNADLLPVYEESL